MKNIILRKNHCIVTLISESDQSNVRYYFLIARLCGAGGVFFLITSSADHLFEGKFYLQNTLDVFCYAVCYPLQDSGLGEGHSTLPVVLRFNCTTLRILLAKRIFLGTDSTVMPV